MTEIMAKVVLVDIEGTTTSISFVHDILFPYAKANVSDYLKTTWECDDTKQIVKDLTETPEFQQYKENTDRTINDELITKFVLHLIEKDLKVTPMKTLQGLIWTKGYQNGELKGHVYDDVPNAFESWRKSGLSIAVYSSGSVAAQKLIFHHSVHGDLLQHISSHFDTHVGHKQQRESYVNIAKALIVEPQDVLFLTDVVAEAEAARAAGMQTIVLNRPGNAPRNAEQEAQFKFVDDFKSLCSLKLP